MHDGQVDFLFCFPLARFITFVNLSNIYISVFFVLLCSALGSIFVVVYASGKKLLGLLFSFIQLNTC